MLQPELPEGIDTVFISSVAQIGLDELKDKLWAEMNKEEGK
jgi:GTP-binding protein